jgi:hypothetical protein
VVSNNNIPKEMRRIAKETSSSPSVMKRAIINILLIIVMFVVYKTYYVPRAYEVLVTRWQICEAASSDRTKLRLSLCNEAEVAPQ